MAVTDPAPSTEAEPLPPPPGADRSVTRSSARWPILGGTAVLAAGIGAYLLANDPNTSAAYPPCVLKHFTGLDCPGCGGMRCVHALLTGDLTAAASHNVLALVLLPLVAYLVVRQLAALFGRELPPLPSFRYTGWVLAVAAFVFTIARNIPGTPLAWLDAAA